MRKWLAFPTLVLLAGAAAGAPPTLEFPADNRPENGYVVVQPKTDAVSVVYVALDDVYPIPPALLADKRTFALPAGGLADGQYRFMAVAAGKGGEQSSKLLVVTIGKGGTVPPPKKKEPDPEDPVSPPPGDVKYYFAVVRPEGAATPAFTKVMQDPAWAVVRSKGHLVKDFTVSQAKAFNIETGAAPLPAVVTLVFSADGKTSFVARPAVPLPTTGDAITRLPELR